MNPWIRRMRKRRRPEEDRKGDLGLGERGEAGGGRGERAEAPERHRKSLKAFVLFL